MNELKPEDVMMALDKLKYGGHSCHDCKYAKWSGEDRCGLNGCRIAKAALALLRGKDALIEDYRQELGRARVALNDANVEIERLTTLAELGKMRANDYRAMREKAKSARAEAITEFAWRLKSCEFYEVADRDGMQYIDFCDWVDQIAKEMKEER